MSRILVIEDDDGLRNNLVDLITIEGYQVVSATDGEEGVQLAWEWQPDLIVCDILMPRLDGYGVLSRLRQDAHTATIPFVFLTALSSQEMMRKGMDLGADDFLNKPFDWRDLRNVIALRLGKKNELTRQALRLDAERFVSLNEQLPRDLLSPMNHVMRFAQTLQDQAHLLAPEKVKEMAGQIHQTVDRILHLAQNYLFLSDLDALQGDARRIMEFQKLVTLHAEEAIEEIARAVIGQWRPPVVVEIDLSFADLRIAYDHLLKIIEESLEKIGPGMGHSTMLSVVGKRFDNRQLYQIRILRRDPREEFDAQYSQNFSTTETSNEDISWLIVQRLVEIYRGEVHVEEKEHAMIITLALPLANEVRQ